MESFPHLGFRIALGPGQYRNAVASGRSVQRAYHHQIGQDAIICSPWISNCAWAGSVPYAVASGRLFSARLIIKAGKCNRLLTLDFELRLGRVSTVTR